MLNPSDLDALRHERQRLQQALSSLDALRSPGPAHRHPPEPPLADAASGEVLTKPALPFIRQPGFDDVVWDELEELPPTSSTGESSAIDDREAGGFTSLFDWGDAPSPPQPVVSYANDNRGRESKGITQETPDDVFTEFEWE